MSALTADMNGWNDAKESEREGEDTFNSTRRYEFRLVMWHYGRGWDYACKGLTFNTREAALSHLRYLRTHWSADLFKKVRLEKVCITTTEAVVERSEV